MKKVLMGVFALVAVLGITKNVYAEAYYTNPNGIELTREEYEFLSDFYSPAYPRLMTRDMYDEFVEYDLMNSEIETVTYTVPPLPLLNPGILPNSDTHITQAKTLHISKGCIPTLCIMSLQNTWTGSPSVRSWDNIGVYLDGVTLISHDATYVDASTGTEWFSNLKTATNQNNAIIGLGNSVDLPDTGENLIINMAFKVSRGGTVYGSYQHAMQNTTLLNSKNYDLDILGYGNVFLYYGNAVGIYDGMNGVDIDV